MSFKSLKISFPISLEISKTSGYLSSDVVNDQDQDCLLALAVNSYIDFKYEEATVFEMYKMMKPISMSPQMASTEPNIHDQSDVANALSFGMSKMICPNCRHWQLIHWSGLSQHHFPKSTLEQRV